MDAVFPTYGRWDLELESGLGTRVTDTMGKTYLDFVAGIAVCNLGHRHPHVQKAIENQLNKIWHVSNVFQIQLQQEVAELLTADTPLDLAFFCNSGAEANEAAIKLARKHTQKNKIITFEHSFHGRTFATMSATGQEKIHKGFGPLLEQFVYVPYNNQAAIEAAIDENTAAIMVEAIQGEGGVVPGQYDFLKKCESLCRKYGALLIIDEVQTGIGRTGKRYAFEHAGLNPDIVTLAKGLGSGFPVGAMLGKEYLKETFQPGSHASTFGGNPLAMAAAKATLEVCFQDSFLSEVTEKGQLLKEKLSESLLELELVKEIRGEGLMIGIVCSEEVAPLLAEFRKEGLIAFVAGSHVLRLVPPLTVSEEEIDEAVGILASALKKVSMNV
jgi:acetylornithine/N-succinyldiaminopimelate aminotransferase